MAKIAHTPNDVKKRRAAFEERWKSFQGRMLNEEQIRKEVFTTLKIATLNTYLSKNGNPLCSYVNGEFSYTEEPFRQALSKAKADLSQFQMSESRVRRPLNLKSWNSELNVYKRNDKAWCHTCLLTYQEVQMKVERWTVEGSPFGSYIITPAQQLSCEKPWVVTETYFFWIDLPRLLMDVALEYSLCKEEYSYHCRQLKVFNMDFTVFDESSITLPDNPELWMPSIENYFLMMKKQYNDTIILRDLDKSIDAQEKERKIHELSILRNPANYDLRTQREIFIEYCKELHVNVEFKIERCTQLSEPSGWRTIGFFMVDGYVLYIEEFCYSNEMLNKCIIFPYYQRPENIFKLNGLIGLHALLGYLKQMPNLCRQIDEFAE